MFALQYGHGKFWTTQGQQLNLEPLEDFIVDPGLGIVPTNIIPKSDDRLFDLEVGARTPCRLS